MFTLFSVAVVGLGAGAFPFTSKCVCVDDLSDVSVDLYRYPGATIDSLTILTNSTNETSGSGLKSKNYDLLVNCKFQRRHCEIGLRQGCTLSPLLFMIVMEELTQRIKKTGVGIRIGKEILNILLFADDVVLLTESWEDMQKLLEEVGKFSEDMEMKFGIDKCKVMMINGKEEENETKRQLQLLGEDIEKVIPINT